MLPRSVFWLLAPSVQFNLFSVLSILSSGSCSRTTFQQNLISLYLLASQSRIQSHVKAVDLSSFTFRDEGTLLSHSLVMFCTVLRAFASLLLTSWVQFPFVLMTEPRNSKFTTSSMSGAGRNIRIFGCHGGIRGWILRSKYSDVVRS